MKYVVIFEINTTAILRILFYTHLLFTTLPLVFYLLFKLKSKQKSLRVILFYVLYCIFNEALNYYLQSIRSEKTIYLFYAFTIVEYSFFCYFIYLILPKSFVRKTIPFLWLSLIIFDLINVIYKNNAFGFDSITSGIECIIILLLCISYLFIQLRGSTSLSIYSTFDFWVVITFLIYFAGTFFLYMLAQSMGRDVAFQRQYFIINIAFNILKNILLCIAMTMKLNDTVKEQKNFIPELDDEFSFSQKI